MGSLLTQTLSLRSLIAHRGLVETRAGPGDLAVARWSVSAQYVHHAHGPNPDHVRQSDAGAGVLPITCLMT